MKLSMIASRSNGSQFLTLARRGGSYFIIILLSSPRTLLPKQIQHVTSRPRCSECRFADETDISIYNMNDVVHTQTHNIGGLGLYTLFHIFYIGSRRASSKLILISSPGGCFQCAVSCQQSPPHILTALFNHVCPQQSCRSYWNCMYYTMSGNYQIHLCRHAEQVLHGLRSNCQNYHNICIDSRLS